MKATVTQYIIVLFIIAFLVLGLSPAQGQIIQPEFERDSIISVMYRVSNYQNSNSWMNIDRNWKRATFYTGLMAFYNVTQDKKLLTKAEYWAGKHGYRVGTDWFFPPNKLTCTQTYLEIYFIKKNKAILVNTKEYMDLEIAENKNAFAQGWDYIDALYVGAPAYAMMSKATSDNKYMDYMNRTFWEVADSLWDKNEKLFYRDLKAKKLKSRNGKKVLWSRGNGWAIASIPRILQYLPRDNEYYTRYSELLISMSSSLAKRQGEDGFWRSNLADPGEFPMPESSGTAFFTYAIAWGINNGILTREQYLPVVEKAWKALYHDVDEDGKVCWGQTVNHKPAAIRKDDSGEYVSGAFLLAGSEILKLFKFK